MSIGVTDRVVTGLAVVAVARCQLDSSAGTELSDPQQVVGSADQIVGETGPLDGPIARAAEVADRLDPAKDLLHPLAHSLAQRGARPTGGAMVKCRAARPPFILRHVGSDTERLGWYRVSIRAEAATSYSG